MTIQPQPFRAIQAKDLDALPQFEKLPAERREVMRAVATVLPFRNNPYVVDQLIDWDDVPGDPIYQLTFPQEGMLGPEHLGRILDLRRSGAAPEVVTAAAREIQHELNPHPAGQVDLNVPRKDGEPIAGMQHKYRETVLFFPSQGQTCHAYCTYCFRWAQFVGLEDQKFASREAQSLVDYLLEHPEVTNVLITGGDPMVMKTSLLRRYVEPLLDDPRLEHLEAIRIGTKALAWWPYRFVTDGDADDFLRLVGEVRAAGKDLSLMAHYSHPRELSTDVAREALRRVVAAGATVRCQAPLIRHVNDRPNVWEHMWRDQVRLGAVPYYMFVERDTGARRYFEVPLARAHHIFQKAYRRVSGLARTVRGPSMSTTPGKVLVDGVTKVAGERVFVLKFLQGRDADWVGRPFFARYDPDATWLDDLRPAFGEDAFFHERDEVQPHRPEPGRRLRDAAR